MTMTSIRAIPTIPRDVRPAHRRRARGLLVAGTVAAMGVLSVLAAGPAMAAPTDDTIVTFELLAGTLDVLAPATADLGTGSPGTVVSGSLGAVTVTDGRASLTPSWTSDVTSTDFVTGAEATGETVPALDVDYWSGAATSTAGTGTFTRGQADAAAAVALDNADPLTAFSHAGGTGNNTATWSPGIVVNVPLANVAGVYTGTVTHSVA